MNQEGSITINDILDLAKTYLHEEKNIHLIEKAFLIAKKNMMVKCVNRENHMFNILLKLHIF